MPVTVTTGQPYYVRGTSGYFKGELTDLGGETSVDCYFQYRIKLAATWDDTSAAAETMSALGEFVSASITLTEGDLYEVRAVATWMDGTAQYAYGSTIEFDAAWIREGSQEDFERGILDGVELDNDEVKLINFLVYDNGNEVVLWETYVESGFTGSLSKGASALEIIPAGSNGAFGGWITQTAIDVTNITNLKFDINLLSKSFFGAVIQVTPSKTDIYATGSFGWSVYETNPAYTTGIITIDVSDKSGYYYLAAGVRCWSTSSVTSSIYEVWGEDEKGTAIYLTGNRQKPYKITDTSADIAWTATTPTDTTLTIEAQVQGTSAITDEAVGTGDGTTTVFTLDYWPANTPTVTVNAVAETGFTLGNDRRTITFTTAPADTHAILASYTAVDDPVVDAVEIQELDLDSPAGGTFKLGDGTTWTADIAYDATAATIETALEGLYGAGNVEVSPLDLWTPAEITTALWLDASDSSTISLDSNGLVDQWNDKSGNLVHATQTSASLRPNYRENVQNDLSVIGLQDSAMNLSWSLTSNDLTFFFACHPGVSSLSDVLAYFLDIATGRLIIGQMAASSNPRDQVCYYDGTWRYVASATADKQILHYELVSPTATIWRDGTSIGTASYTQKAIGGTVRLFATAASDTNHAVGDIYEIIAIHGTISATNKEYIEGYLSHKWGLEGNLPAAQPYKTDAPIKTPKYQITFAHSVGNSNLTADFTGLT